MARVSLRLLNLILNKTKKMYEGFNALTAFEDGVLYVVETADGMSTGMWNEEKQAFCIEQPDGYLVFKKPSFIDPESDLVAWEKTS